MNKKDVWRQFEKSGNPFDYIKYANIKKEKNR